MNWLRAFRAQPWWPASASVVGLLVAMAIAGLAGLAINARVKNLTDRALQYDVELEDRGNELRLALLELHHIHRNILLSDVVSRASIADFEAAHTEMLYQIDRLDLLGVRDQRLTQPDRLRGMVKEYYATFRPAIDVYATDRDTFTRASDEGLAKLSDIGRATVEIGLRGEERSQAALVSLDAATTSAQQVQIAVLIGLVLVGAVLGYTTVRMVREQQATADKLAYALQAKSDFIADASHELRTPLTVLRGNAEIALELDRSCVHTELLEEIVEESERMTALVEDLLFLARSDAGTLPLALETVDVEPFMVEVSERAMMLARGRGTSVATALHADGQINIDPVRMSQVVLILVDNAAKYSPPDAPVTIVSQTNADDLLIEVRDQGPGIPAAELPLVFERFYRVDKARVRKQGGAGLGLAIAKTIVEAHGGRIEAESVLNQGTTMRVCLPRMVPRDTAPSFVSAEPVGERA